MGKKQVWIDTLYKAIDCDKLRDQPELTGVSESNLMNYLGVIEHRVTDIMHAYMVLQSSVPFHIRF